MPSLIKIAADVDDYPISASLFESEEPCPGPVVQIQSATGMSRRFYDKFAAHLVANGCRAVITYDYRGTGEGITTQMLKSMPETTIQDHWAKRDQPGITRFLRERFPNNEIVLIGHSVGGHIAPLNPRIAEVSRVLFVSANSAYWRYATEPIKRILFPVMVRLHATLYGYFAATLIKLCDDLPTGVGIDWSTWSLYRKYCTIVPDIKAAYDKFDKPSLFLSFEDDELSLKGGFSTWIELLGKPPDWKHINPTDLGIKRVGHLGFFKVDALWPGALDFVVRGRPYLIPQRSKL